ncbi:hypothetical protein NQ314_010798 [Rhamnusium bicolor]|uniref:Uncharacterized protein n=1 Tax=Rhamnusium bicolor TaxID=1586634 RepID=A0AAV8XMF2_9CUCU|nr:hypothetical protein NQ314_010798 [Rhamnusium bicolor]
MHTVEKCLQAVPLLPHSLRCKTNRRLSLLVEASTKHSSLTSSIEPVVLSTCTTSHQESIEENQVDSSVTITAVPAGVQQRRSSVERVETVESIPADADADVDEIKETIVVGNSLISFILK